MRKSFLATLLMLVLPMAAPAMLPHVVIPPIFHALDDTNIEKARAIITADPKAVNARILGVTPLELIANTTAKVPYNPVDIMRERIREEDETNSPIPRVAQLLVEKGADVNAKDDAGDTALMYALFQKKISLACWLLDHGADVNTTDHLGGTPLYSACAKGEATLAEMLMAKGADVKVAERDGHSLLVRAIINQEPDLVKVLIAKGANVNAVLTQKGLAGTTLLHVAAVYGDTNTVSALLAAGCKIDVTNNLGQTPLLLAAEHAWLPLVDFLLQKGAAVNVRDARGNTPLNTAQAALAGNPNELDGVKKSWKIIIKHLKKHGGAA